MKCSECIEFIEENEYCKRCKEGVSSATSFWVKHEDDSVDMNITDGDCLYFKKVTTC